MGADLRVIVVSSARLKSPVLAQAMAWVRFFHRKTENITLRRLEWPGSLPVKRCSIIAAAETLP